MSSLSARGLLPLVLLAGFSGLAGCARRGGGTTSQPSPEKTEAPAPSTRETSVSPTRPSAELQPLPNEPIQKVLQGRVSGVDVSTAPDGGIAVRIRGATSSGSTEPLYVLDGMAITPGPGGSLSGVSPYDIESIRVLKDPADLTMYGSRGANGVILIKTKRAVKSKQP